VTIKIRANSIQNTAAKLIIFPLLSVEKQNIFIKKVFPRLEKKNICNYAKKLLKIELDDSRGGRGSGVPESTLTGFCVFLSDLDPDPESKFCEKTDPDLGVTLQFWQ